MRLVLAVAVAFISTSAWAEKARPIVKSKPNSAEIDAQAEDSAEQRPSHGNSYANRHGKTGYVGAEAGLGLTFPAAGLEAGYFFSPQLMANINYIESSFSVFFAKVKMDLLSVNALWFVNNSFYLTGGLGRRSIKIDFSLDAITVNGTPISDALNSSASVANYGLNFGIGNRWQWDSFWLGTQWVGYFLPLAKSGGSKINPPAGASQKDVDDLQKNFDKLGNLGNYELLRLQLGWAF